MPARSENGVTLVELMVVIIIIGVLVALALVQFSAPREQMIEKEALASLKLIASAQKVYRMEYETYVGASNATQINQRLRLRLPNTTGTAKWNYTIDNGTTWFRVNATRVDASGKSFFINESMENASSF